MPTNSDEPSRMQQIAQEIKQHYVDNPTHGVGCSCIDKYGPELRREFSITPYWLHEEDEATMKAGHTMAGILYRVASNLYQFQRSKCTCPDDPYGVLPPAPDCLICFPQPIDEIEE